MDQALSLLHPPSPKPEIAPLLLRLGGFASYLRLILSLSSFWALRSLLPGVMASEPSSEEQKRSALRDTYRKKVEDLFSLPGTQPQRIYDEAELKALGVELALFDPEDASFLQSNDCSFELVPEKELEKWDVDLRGQHDGVYRIYEKFDEIYDNPTGMEKPSAGYLTEQRARSIFERLDIIRTTLVRKKKGNAEGRGSGLERFKHQYGWDQFV